MGIGYSTRTTSVIGRPRSLATTVALVGTNPMVWAQSPGSIKIGAFGPMSGNAAAQGQSLREGVEMVVNLKNAGGGVLGRQPEHPGAQGGQEKSPSETPRRGLRGSGRSAQQSRSGTSSRRRGQPLVRGVGATGGNSVRSAGPAEGQGGDKQQGSQGGARNARNRKKRRKR